MTLPTGRPVFADAVMLILDRSKSPDVEIPVATSLTPDELALERPRAVALHPAFPNRFNPTTHIRFQLEESARVQLTVYDMLGRQVATLG